MSEYLIQGETLTGIADAIRGKTGGTAPVAVSDMAAQIEGIQAGGGGDDVLYALLDRSITEISSRVTSIGAYAFRQCNKMTKVDFPAATTIGTYAFTDCHELTKAVFPAVTKVDSYAFRYNSGLKMVDFPAATTIGGHAFDSCSALTEVILRSDTMVVISNTAVFNGTPIKTGTGYIYVPSALIEQYKVADNWPTYATQFRALEDYTVDGTTTGELDPNKI